MRVEISTPQCIFYFVEKAPVLFHAFGLRTRLKIIRVAHFLQHIPFIIGQILWRPYVYFHQLITFLLRLECREALALQPEYLTALCTGRYFDLSLSINCRYFHAGAQYRFRERNVEVMDHVHICTPQVRMFFFFYNYQQIAGRSAAFAGVATAAHAQLHAFLYACRYIQA